VSFHFLAVAEKKDWMLPKRPAIEYCDFVVCRHDKRRTEEVDAHPSPHISRNFGLEVTLKRLDMLLRTRFKIHRLGWVNIEE
jgi:hypothetical protein